MAQKCTGVVRWMTNYFREYSGNQLVSPQTHDTQNRTVSH